MSHAVWNIQNRQYLVPLFMSSPSPPLRDFQLLHQPHLRLRKTQENSSSLSNGENLYVYDCSFNRRSLGVIASYFLILIVNILIISH
jgi:hypothetical protein